MDAKKELVVTQDDTKSSIRTKVWDYLEATKVASSPWPPHKRIPNYKTAKETADKTRELSLFKSAKTIKIDPDKPLQHNRYFALVDGKTLLVPVPRLSSYFMNKLEPSDDNKRNWNCSSKSGLLMHTNPVDLEKKEKVDLIIVGAVAVSPKGWRIGKGMGFSDLEYAMMSVLGFIDSNVKVVACIHDCQVIENMPESIFEQHDVPVDVIVTPTRVIECQGMDRPCPNEIFWNMLTKSQLESIPALRKLRYMEWKSGKTICRLKDETEAPTDLKDVELKAPQRKNGVHNWGMMYDRNFRRTPGKSRNSGRRFVNGVKDNEERNFRSRRSFGEGKKNSADHDGSGDTAKEAEGKGNNFTGNENASRRSTYNDRMERRNRTSSGQGESWLYIGNIPWNVRVSEFKQQVKDVIKMQPLRVVWRGPYGFAFLNFAKSSEAKEALVKLEGMMMLNRQLKVELAQKKERKYSGTDGKAGNKTYFDGEKSEVDNAAEMMEERLVIDEHAAN